MLDKVINVGLLKNPLNWITVLLMLIIFGIAADVVLNKLAPKE